MNFTKAFQTSQGMATKVRIVGLIGLLSVATAQEGNFQNTDLKRRSFQRKALDGFNFSRAKGDSSNFVNANGAGTNFANASMKGTNFKSAQLDNVNFQNTDFTGAKLITFLCERQF